MAPFGGPNFEIVAMSNFDLLYSMLTDAQREKLEAVRSALQEDPTCLDTHIAGADRSQQTEVPSGQ